VKVCGRDGANGLERRQPASLVIPHSAQTLTMRVTTNLDQTGWDERYAQAENEAEKAGWATRRGPFFVSECSFHAPGASSFFYSFALDNVHLSAPATHAWPSVDTFDGGADGWVGTSTRT
jgi:hypothetical protein